MGDKRGNLSDIIPIKSTISILTVFAFGLFFIPAQAEALEFSKNIGGQNDLMLPYDVEVDSQGRIIVTNTVGVGNGMGLSIFDSSGKLIQSLGKHGTAPGEFNFPTGVAVDSKDRIIVADKQINSIQILDKSGKHVKTFGGIGSEDGQLRTPFGVSTDSQDRIIVADTGNNRVQIFDSDGNFVKAVGGTGSGDNNFRYPADVATDSQDRIWVADAQNNRLAVYDKEGNFVKIVGRLGGGNAEFNFPQGIAVDKNDRVLVSDQLNYRAQILDSEGNYIETIGSQGTDDGRFTVASGITSDLAGNILVADLSNNKVLQWGSATDLIDPPSMQIEVGPSDTEVKKIPEWINNTMQWYLDGVISEDEMISAIQFLVKEGIIILD